MSSAGGGVPARTTASVGAGGAGAGAPPPKRQSAGAAVDDDEDAGLVEPDLAEEVALIEAANEEQGRCSSRSLPRPHGTEENVRPTTVSATHAQCRCFDSYLSPLFYYSYSI